MTTSKQDTGMNRDARRLRVLHVGPGHGQRGGMASVLQELRDMRAHFASEAAEVAFFETRGFRSIGALARFAVQDIPQFALAAWRADIVHFHVSARGSLYRKLVLFAIAKLARRRSVFHLHAGDFDQFAARAGRATRHAIHWFVGCADAAVGVSASCAGVLNRFRPGADARVIGNSARDAQLVSSVVTTTAARPTIAFAGRLTRQKGIDVLIDALSLLEHAGCDVDLTLAGEGDIPYWRAYAEARGVAHRVRFAGWLDGKDKAALYRDATVFCLPSQFESFGIAALEAMFHGTPVVATRIGGLADLVEHGTTGYLVAPNDGQALAAALHRIVSQPWRRRQMGIAARALAHRRYAAETIAGQYVDCHRAIVARTAPASTARVPPRA